MFLIELLFGIPVEIGDSKLLRNVDTYVTNCALSYSRKLEFSVLSISQFEVPLC
jgi:hypothetical protein